jgi:hypothetical protein
MTDISISGFDSTFHIRDLVALLSDAARVLARKGFAASAPQTGKNGCSLTVLSKRFGFEARIGFVRNGAGVFKWSSVVVSDHTAMVSECGTVASNGEAGDRLQGFMSVISTVASFAQQ